MQDNYFLEITKDWDNTRPRTFTGETNFDRCPGWKKQIEACFNVVQKICDPNLLISTKEKGRYDISIIHGYTESVRDLLNTLECRTEEHCIKCGKQADSRGAYQAPICELCHRFLF